MMIQKGLLVFCLIVSITFLHANQILVENSNDAGPGSLRQAVLDATSGDTISFDAAINGLSIILTTGEISLNKNLTMIGNGREETVLDGNGISRIFQIPTGFVADIRNLKIQNGNGGATGGGIDNRGSVFLSNCELTNNRATAGAAIYAFGALETSIQNCKIVGNYAPSGSNGGAVTIFSNVNPFRIQNTILTGNRSGRGGGIYSHSSNGVVTNSTISGNMATLDGGGLWYFSSTITFTNSIISGNSANGGGPDAWKQSTAANPIDNGYNLIGNISGSGNSWTNTGTMIAVDPLFAQNIPAAPTTVGDVSLMAGSPAIDAGTPDTTGLNIGFADASGNPRISGSRIDIGGFELNVADALHFDGIDDYVLVDLAPGSFFHSGYTIEMWVKFDGDPANQNVFVLTDLNGPEDFYSHQIRVNKNGFFEHSSFFNDESKVLVHPTKPQADEWYYVKINARSFTSSENFVMTVNDQFIATTIVNGSLLGGNFFYLGFPACGHQPFKGTMSEVRIWNSYFSESQNITQLDGNEPYLLNYYRFSSGIGEGDNTNPAVDSVRNAIQASDLPSAKLFNFGLNGPTSNWVSCNQNSSIDSLAAQPSDIEIEHGQPGTFNLSPPMEKSSSIQWYKDNEIIEGANGSTLSFPNATFADEGDYYAVVTPEGECPIRSRTAKLVVNGTGETLNFDGINDYLDITSLHGADGWLTELWVKFEGDPSNRAIITGTDEQGPNLTFSNQIYTDENGFFSYHTKIVEMFNPVKITGKTTIQAQPNTWYHVALHSDRDFIGVKLYVDGQLAHETDQVVPLGGSPRYIVGGAATTSDNGNTILLKPFNGEMDELRLWNNRRSTAQINETKDIELTNVQPSDSTRIAHYFKFNRGIADSDNTNPTVDFIPDFGNIYESQSEIPEVKMVNFDFEGPVSNWSDCSPLTSPKVSLTSSELGSPFVGESYFIAAVPENTFELYDYKWRKNDVDIPGETDSILTFANFQAIDVGTYECIVSTLCETPIRDTLSKSIFTPGCYATENLPVINYPAQTNYVACTNPSECPIWASTITYKTQRGYCDDQTEYPGGELVYKLTTDSVIALSLILTNLDSDLDLFLYDESCDLDQCISNSRELGTTDETLTANLDTGTYYIIIDTKNPEAPNNFELIVEIFDSKCVAAESIECGDNRSSTTDTNADLISNYGNNPDTYNGTEKSYVFTLSEQKTIRADLTNLSEDLDLFLLDTDCIEDSLIIGSTKPGTTDEFIIQPLEPGEYYLVVDGKNGVTGEFDLSLECLNFFDATMLDNDAYVDLTWNLDKASCVPADTGVIVKLIDETNTTLFEQEFTTAALTPDVISGSFRHYLGPDITRNYVVRVFNRLTNKKICEQFATGSTTPFAEPFFLIVPDETYPDSIRVQWENNSKLSDQFRIYRDGQQIANLTEGYTEIGQLVTFVDAHNPSDNQSIQNGVLYNYCVETYSAVFNQTYSQVCVGGNTLPIGFSASDGNPTDVVEMNWNNLSGYGTELRINRNGIPIASLETTETSYIDESPVNGQNSVYSLAIEQDGITRIEVEDTGSTPRNGEITGLVRTAEGNYPLAGIEIELFKDTTIQGSETEFLVDSTMTDFKGAYGFSSLYYELSNDFTVKAVSNGLTFEEPEIDVNLNGAIPVQTDINFIETSISGFNQVMLIDTFFPEVDATNDRIKLKWGYTYNPNDTIFFNVFRGGNLIGQLSDAEGKIDSLVDLNGIPGQNYLYTLQAFTADQNMFDVQELFFNEVFPQIEPPTNVVVQSKVDPRVTLSWDLHPSSNIAGYKIYRDDILVRELTPDQTSYEDRDVNPGASVVYELSAYRTVNGLDYESALRPDPAVVTPVATLIPPMNLTIVNPGSPDQIILEWDVDNNLNSSYDYDGFVIQRKETGSLNFTDIATIKKNFAPAGSTQQHADLTGIPGQSYDYFVGTFVKIGDSLIVAGSQVTTVFPEVTIPSGFSANGDYGRVDLMWSTTISENLDGWRLYRKDLTNGGSSDSLTTQTQFEGQHTDYVNNPVYDAFLDDYETINYEYELKSIRIVDGQTYLSNGVTLTSFPTSEMVVVEPLVSNVVATRNLIDQIKICWDWEAAKQSAFIVYRGNIAIDTMPTSARAYYDYDAPQGKDVEYAISSLNNGNESAKVYTTGRLASLIEISGRVENVNSKVGIAGVKISLNDLNLDGCIHESTTTDITGGFSFVNIPGIDTAQFQLTYDGLNVDFDSTVSVSQKDSIQISFDTSTTLYSVTILEYSELELDTSAAKIQGVVAKADAQQMGVQISWSPTNGNFSGFEIYRMNKKIGEVLAGEPMQFFDDGGFPGITYIYRVGAYFNTPTGRVFSERVPASAVFPGIDPVQFLTAAAYPEQNKMLISWSHPTNNVDGFRLRRNGNFMAFIGVGQPLMWYDTSGIPGQQYQYEVTAIKNPLASDPVIVTANFKGVGEVRNLTTSIPGQIVCDSLNTSQNHVLISWEYDVAAADGFEIYRDDDLIAEINDVALAFAERPNASGTVVVNKGMAQYQDFQGLPGTMHEYTVLPFVIREGARYTSGVEELVPDSEILYPEISEVLNLNAESNLITGSVDLSFEFPIQIVRGFQIIRDGMVIDTVFSFDQPTILFSDETGDPGVTYQYAVRAYVQRQGISYLGESSCLKEVTFPDVPVPQNLSASQGEFINHIDVSWSYDISSFVDSFYVENLSTGIATALGSGSRLMTEVVNDNTFKSFDYRIRAARIKGNTTLYSDWSDIVTGYAQVQVNGDDAEDIIGDCDAHRLGYDVAIDGEWAVAGATGGTEQLNIYRRIEGGWKLFEIKESPTPLADVDFGFAVAIQGDWIIAGSPIDGKAYSYQWNGQSWGFPSLVDTRTGRFGHSIAMDGNKLLISSPIEANGFIHSYELEAGQWVFKQSIGVGNSSLNLQGLGLGISGDYMVVTTKIATINGTGTGQIYYYKYISGNWVYQNLIGNYSNVPGFGGGFYTLRTNIDMDGDWLVVGDPYFDNGTGLDFGVGAGRCLIYQRDANGVYQFNGSISPAGLVAGDGFGTSVAISEIPSPSDPSTYVLSGAIGRIDQNVYRSGAAYLYSNFTGNWDLSRQLEPIVRAENDEYGHAVDLSQDAMMIGIPLRKAYDRGAVEIKNLLLAPLSVDATDGISIGNDPSKTTVSWIWQGNKDLVFGFNIYRDDELIAFRNMATTTDIGNNTVSGEWDDNSANPGQRYIYTVKAVNSVIPFESKGTSDEGNNRANGIIFGSVRTEIGQVPVPGVTVRAVGIVEGEIYSYETTTLPNGDYTFNQIYYDSDPNIASVYTMTAEYLDHIIIAQNTDQATLNSLNDPVQTVINFIDQTAYVIKGRVTQPNVDCPLAGVEIDQVVNGEIQVGLGATTDENGEYSLVINPNQPGLNQLRIRINNIIRQDLEETEYFFVPDGDTTFSSFTNFPIVTELNFEDQLIYQVSLKVKNTCLDPISTGRWNIRIRTLDGCFDEQYQTNTSGDLLVDLLPLNYQMKVVGVDDLNGPNQLAVDYFANFPTTLNLLGLHRDSSDIYTPAQIEEKVARNFTYHKAPDVQVNGFDEFFCNSDVAVVQQGEEYTLNFSITEIHGGSTCAVQEGIVTVTNPASTSSQPVDILYDPISESFPEYRFEAGSPNQSSPHIYAVTFDYKSNDGGFLGRVTRAVFVEGSVALPGTDILVDAANGNDAVPYPLMVLRDPPGDGSSSYIESGETFNFTSALTTTDESGLSVFASLTKDILVASTQTSGSITANSSDAQRIEYSNSVTTSQRIETSSDIFNIGRNADVIVGAGLVMQYGLVNEFSVGECDTILKVTKYGISPNAAPTTWSYTVKQVEDIIQGYLNDSLRIEAGTLIIENAGRELSKAEAREFVSTNIDNWREVIRYHSVETVPYYILCTLNPYAFDQATADAINVWQSQLKPFFGEFVNGEFILFDEIIWDAQLIEFYNAAATAIRNLIEGGEVTTWAFPYQGNPAFIDLTIPLIDFALVNFQEILSLPGIQTYAQTFGPQVENITTGGNVMIEKSINNVQASTTNIQNSVFLSKEFEVQGTIGSSITVFGGFFAGLGAGVVGGIIKEISSPTFTLGRKANINFSRTNEYQTTVEESVTVGYTIYDDDITDAFSVAVIQGADQFHTPYFEQFGGHTSCPPEVGTVWVDNPLISILDPETGATSQTKSLFNIPADEAAVFQIIIENQTPLASLPDRETIVFLENEDNDNGAVVRLNGIDLAVANFMDSLAAFEPDTLTLTIERGPVFYDYEDIKIGIQPSCDDEGPKRFIFVSAYFQTPCSPVSIVTPDPQWVINGDDNFLQIGIQDYDPDNENLDEVILEYRRLGTGDDWTPVPILELGLSTIVDTSTLIAYNSMLAEGQIPTYYFDWTLPDELSAYPDGEYEIRVQMDCGASANISNAIPGTIAREGLHLFGTPEPADQIWTSGDEISFSFNKDLDCALINQSFIDQNIFVLYETTGDTLGFTIACFGNQIIFQLDQPMSDFDGQFLTMVVNDIPSISGNVSDEESWTFRVVTQSIYWSEADTLKIRMYAGDTMSLMTRLENSSEVPEAVGLQAKDGMMDAWIGITDPSNPASFTVSPFGRPVKLFIDANEEIGLYDEAIEVTGLSGNIPTLNVQLEILSRPPDWIVDPGDFSSSMNLITNWRFSSDPDSLLSTDTVDLISAWYEGEIRGVAPVRLSGSSFYAAYLTIYGKASDPMNIELEFRVWDADKGFEYDAHPTSTVVFIENVNIGTTSNPEILNVDRDTDLARYIPLRNGWTGFSLNTITANMDVMYKLRTLKNISDGDLIKTNNAFAIYDQSTGWFDLGSNGLKTVNTDRGYMIYLQNGPDTLRLTGAIPIATDLQLERGWNWIGFPFENTESIDQAFDVTNATGNDVIKVDFPLPDSLPTFAQYDLVMDEWVGTLNHMSKHQLYKLYLDNLNGGDLSWTGGNNVQSGNQQSSNRNFNPIADPTDESTWNMDVYNSDLVMPVVAEIYIDSILNIDTDDRVAFFKNDTLYGVSQLIAEPLLEKTLIAAIVEGDLSDYQVLLFDASENQIYSASQMISFQETGFGTFEQPYRFDFKSCPRDLILTVDDSPLSGIYEAEATITIMGAVEIMNGVMVELRAPLVRVIDQVNTFPASEVIIRPDGCAE